jgi:hypothetical protein
MVSGFVGRAVVGDPMRLSDAPLPALFRRVQRESDLRDDR